MSIRNRSARILFVAVTTIAVSSCAFPDYWQHLGLDFWNMGRYETEVLEEEARMARLELVSNEAISRLYLKMEIVDSVIDNRMTLAQAIEECLVLNRIGQDVSQAIHRHFPAPTLEESTALHVISFARAKLASSPAEIKERVMARLECEKRDLKLPLH
jgi:hypothetical protein